MHTFYHKHILTMDLLLIATIAADERSSTDVTGAAIEARPRGLEKFAGTIPLGPVNSLSPMSSLLRASSASLVLLRKVSCECVVM